MLILFALINIRLTVTESPMNRTVLASRFRKLVRPAGAIYILYLLWWCRRH